MVQASHSLKSTKDAVNEPFQRLHNYLAPELQATDALIKKSMLNENVPRIFDITSHLIAAGGKRIRPLLTLAAARICGYEEDKHIPLAAAVELIHTATLLHDDVVDLSEKRRGKPTANLLWDNKSSILVGDYLFARSFQLMTLPGDIKILSILSDAATTITEGEVLQLVSTQDITISEETYIHIIKGKTAALFSAAAKVGGMIASASEQQTKALQTYGDALGIAFQITDDLLDYTGDASVTGKNTGDDFRDRKLTLPMIKAISKASADENAFWQRTIGQGHQKEGDWEEALELMKTHDALGSTRAEAQTWAELAHSSLNELPEHPLRDTLADLSTHVIKRIS